MSNVSPDLWLDAATQLAEIVRLDPGNAALAIAKELHSEYENGKKHGEAELADVKRLLHIARLRLASHGGQVT